MFAGNIGKGQAVDVIVEAAVCLAEYPDIRFVVLGHGSQWEWMQQQVREKDLSNVHLPGRYAMETMPGLMQKASVLLVLLADRPIFTTAVPNKIQAYMSVGRPILASLNGEGARIVMEANAGLAVPAEDAKALAAAVLQLYSMPDEDREKLGANGRQYYNNHYDHNKLVDQLIEHFSLVTQSA
jgi:glycosyltransferase involved in cell wall biosynthesis